MSAKIDLSSLAQFTGSQQWFKWWCGGIYLTEGVHYLAANGASWLIDAIASHQRGDLLKGDLKYFQIWTLVAKGEKAVLTCKADSERPAVVTQNIEFTDFPDGTVTLYLELGSVEPLVQQAANVYYSALQLKFPHSSVPQNDVEWHIIPMTDGTSEINILWENWDQSGSESGSINLSISFVLNENGQQEACLDEAKAVAAVNAEKARLDKIRTAEQVRAAAERTIQKLSCENGRCSTSSSVP